MSEIIFALVVGLVCYGAYYKMFLLKSPAVAASMINSDFVKTSKSEDPRERVKVLFAGRWCEGRLVRRSSNGITDLVELTDRRCCSGQRIARSREEVVQYQQYQAA